ncbi:MAG TPA: hypothetical protein VJ761_18715 [Ktedonobacteraceae bacterium]|nr:hypothetical protein [Ktedonobacteraceae bacterium]
MIWVLFGLLILFYLLLEAGKREQARRDREIARQQASLAWLIC